MRKKLKKFAKKVIPNKIKNYIRGRKDIPIDDCASQLEMVICKSNSLNNYLEFKNIEQKFLLSYLKIERDNIVLPECLELILNNDKQTIVFPLNYDLKLGQRPDEILLSIAKTGKFNCIFLSYDSIENDFLELSENAYITSYLWQTISYLQKQVFIFYFTHPRYMNFRHFFENAIFVYDCLDEPSVLADSDAESYNQDFMSAISGSDITLFSSQVLFFNYGNKSKHPILIKNGINLARYKTDETIITKPNLFGYIGVISELLDFEFFNHILEADEKNEILLIGPVKAFEDKFASELNKNMDLLKNNSRVSYIPYVEKNKLYKHISTFNYGVIPFIVSEKTNGVLPLKLFEYMACNKPIISSKIDELLSFKDKISYYDGTARSIKDFIKLNLEKSYTDYSTVLDNHTWDYLVEPLINSLISFTQDASLRENDKFIDILNFQYFDFTGEYLYKGGAERYVYDLSKVIQNLGFKPRIIQQAKYYFYQFVNKDIPVIGIPTYSYETNNIENYKSYYARYFNRGVISICSPFELSLNLKQYLGNSHPVIGINHGIYWDDVGREINNVDSYFFTKVIKSIKGADSVVCVDTNFINWVRTIDYQAATTTVYIPNYYDAAAFKCFNKNFLQDKIHICYPRRVYKARGSELLFNVIEKICSKYKNVIFDVVGQFDSKNELQQYNDLKKRFDKQLNHYEYEMHEMWKAYQESHIILIPTCFSEGTSLSCIEAMATNNAIIATNVGGLPNLIFDEFNGLLINPDSASLLTAIEKLINNRELIQKLSSNALNVVQGFEKVNWGIKWVDVISKYLNSSH